MIKEDIGIALEYLKNSNAIYSNFKVASVLTDIDGNKYIGVNIELPSLTNGVCAERNALYHAMAEGAREFKRIVVVGGLNGEITELTPPCGVCRQALMDTCDPETFEVIVAIDQDNYKIFKLKDLVPMGFGPENLEG